MIEVKLIGITKPVIEAIPEAADLVAYCARVSNPQNQSNFETAEGLLRYCIRNQHWSVFEMINIVMEIKAPRDIARQILRHRSFSFQEFSQRYAEVSTFCLREARLQDAKNRQNSVPTEDADLHSWWQQQQEALLGQIDLIYNAALEKGIAKECARVVLPEGLTMSSMYMNGTARSWLHYCDLRTGNGTQLEHQMVAKEIERVLQEALPSIFKKEE